MQTNKLKTLISVKSVKKTHAFYDTSTKQWIIRITYGGVPPTSENLERQRGGPRTFSRLDGIAIYLSQLGIHSFTVDASGYQKHQAENPP